MAVTIYTKSETFVNGTANDAEPVDNEFARSFENAQTLAGAVNDLDAGRFANTRSLTLNYGATAAPASNAHAFLAVNRGSLPTVSLRWNETSDQWELTSDGTNYFTISTSGSMVTDYGVGCDATWLTSNTIQIAAGRQAASDRSRNITVASPITLNITTNGAGGLDTGSAINNTWYYVWLIQTLDGANTSAILSASSTAPTLPTSPVNYTGGKVALLKADIFYTTANGIRPFLWEQDGAGQVKMWWRDLNVDVNNPTSEYVLFFTNGVAVTSSWQTITGTTLLSPRAKRIMGSSFVSLGGTGGQLSVRPKGSEAIVGRPINHSIFLTYASSPINDFEVLLVNREFEIRAVPSFVSYCVIWGNGFVL